MKYEFILIILCLIVILYVIITYNLLRKAQNRVLEAFATMDVYLKKRWDLLPNLVATVKNYAFHEKETIEETIRLRNQVYQHLSMNKKIVTNENITNNLANILLIAENYPELKANQNYLKLQSSLISIEDEIANARKYYNAVIRKYNNLVEMFPSNLVAQLFKFKQLLPFTINKNERNNVMVNKDER